MTKLIFDATPEAIGGAGGPLLLVLLVVLMRPIALQYHAAWRFERAAQRGWDTDKLATVLSAANTARRAHDNRADL